MKHVKKKLCQNDIMLRLQDTLYVLAAENKPLPLCQKDRLKNLSFRELLKIDSIWKCHKICYRKDIEMKFFANKMAKSVNLF